MVICYIYTTVPNSLSQAANDKQLEKNPTVNLQSKPQNDKLKYRMFCIFV